MKINNCKLCEIYDNQKLSGDKSSINAQPQFCRHTSAAAAAAFISPNHIRDFLAFHLLRGYYQPAGPLISPHLLPPQPIPQSLESDQTQSSQSSASTTDNVDPDVMITGGDLAPRPPYRYGPHPPPPDYPRPMHQMHYQTYPPSPYGYFGQPPPPPHQEICYSPSPYYPPKYYQQNVPYARHPNYMTSNYSNYNYQPPPLEYRPQAVPPNAYAGYSQSGYSQTPPRSMQPPFLDAPQYHSSSCPCPMQSCPKNALTGTGPTNKGPVSANNTMAIAENMIPKTPSTACKIENILAPSVTIKPENKEKKETTKTQELYKVLDTPDLAPSPARGSTGLQIPLTAQHEAVQPSESSLNHSSDSVSLCQRKQPRVGKSMERERQQQQHISMSGYQTSLDNSEMVVSEVKQEFVVKKETDVKKEKDCDEVDTEYRIENIKLERPEEKQETITLATTPAPEPIDAMTVNLMSESGDECIDYSMKRKLNDSSSEDVIELSDSNSTVDPPSSSTSAMSILKRRKLLEKPVSTMKKSPPNSYKNLIKQSNASTGTYPAPTSKSKLITSSINRTGSKTCIKRRSILKSKSSLKKMRLAVKSKKRVTKKKKAPASDKSSCTTSDEAAEARAVLGMAKDTNESFCKELADKSNEDEKAEEIFTEHNEEKSMDGSSEYSGKSNLDLTIDRVAKGYFSESDIFSCLSKQRKLSSKKKLKEKLMKSSAKDKKNDKKSKKPKSFTPETTEKTKKKNLKANKEADKQESLADDDNDKAKKTKENKKKAKKKPEKEVEVAEKDPLALDDNIPSSHSTPKRKQKAAAKKSKKVIETTTVVDSDEDDKATVVTIETRDEETSTTVLSSTQTINTSKSTLLDETDVANNNNECFEDNNRQKQQESLTLYKTPGYGWTTFNKSNGKRGKKAKFGKSKKHKFTLLNDIVIPKSTSIPRWSNGWVWEAEPFQALVFLNSEDPPVPRTCYDSMRHEECGDIIRPGDCVLLRAGGKRNELPYVAKVAQLWENPEDGEMMMSLFWYYRPEHTEQGRLENDASDEVFASRHKDHNSVACIEDKCFVLTYNEYCRYRRNLKSLEENLEEQPSLVPKLNYVERRVVPPSTSPELVMFCRRVYDFRSKRLVEDKKKK